MQAMQKRPVVNLLWSIMIMIIIIIIIIIIMHKNAPINTGVVVQNKVARFCGSWFIS